MDRAPNVSNLLPFAPTRFVFVGFNDSSNSIGTIFLSIRVTGDPESASA